MIVITAPTAQIGRQLINNLLDSGEQLRVVARRPDRLPEPVRRRTEVIEGSHGDREVADRAFAGADAVFWLYPSDPTAADARQHLIDFTRAGCEAITRHQVPRVVTVSALGRGVIENAGLVSMAWQMDDLIAATGTHLRALTLPTFTDNLLRQVASIRDHGVFFQPVSADRRMPMVATRDIAAAAADLLLHRTWTGNGTRAVLGPQVLSFDQVAEILSEELGRPVRCEFVSTDTQRAQLAAAGYSASMIDMMTEMMVAKEKGLDDAEPRTLESISPTTVRTWCQEVLKPAVERTR